MPKQSIGSGLALVSFFLCVSCNSQQFATMFNPTAQTVEIKSPKIKKIVNNAVYQTGVTRGYDPAYVKLTYPGGDVPMSTGVCTDVVIRAFRSISLLCSTALVARCAFGNNIQNTKEIQGAGCSLQRKGKKGDVFWSPFERSALMNIDGKDRVLKFVSETPSQQDLTKKGGRAKKGDRSTVIYKSGKMTVQIDRIATRVCRQGDQECESTSYDGKLKLNIGDRQQVIAVEGECGS